jgi:alanine dehydrogenase
MIVGVPKENKADEYRVAVIPAGVRELAKAGHKVIIQTEAGEGSGIPTHDYSQEAEIVATAEEVWRRADLIVKVKEPSPEEWPLLRRGQIVSTFFHFAANEKLTQAVLQSGITAVAYETIRDAQGQLPVLAPMSEVAGRMSVQEGGKYLEWSSGGRGILLGGVPGVPPASVVIVGGGVVGTNAAKVAAGFGAAVTVLDINLDRLRYLNDVMPKNVTTLFNHRQNLLHSIARADLIIGAVLVPGAKAPRVLKRDDLRDMKRGSVIVDVSIDQGGCVETAYPTTHSHPTYVVDDVLHYCVTNIPGAVARTSTFALARATLPYILHIANKGLDRATRENPGLGQGVSIRDGKVTSRAVAETFGLDYQPFNVG